MDRPTRIHVAVGVSNLVASRDFYTRLLGNDPTIVTHDQIDWILDSPAVNFSIFFNTDKPVGVEHIGLDFAHDEFAAGQERIGSTELAVLDPDGLRVELFSKVLDK